MATIRLEVSDAGIRPYGFYSRDRADEAVTEVKALIAALAADRRPVAVRWQRDGEVLVPKRLPMFRDDRPALFEWDADTGALVGEAAGAPIEASADGRTFRITWAGRALSRAGGVWVDAAGDRIGPDVPLRVVVDGAARLRPGRIVVAGLGLDGDAPLPRDATVRARLVGGGELDLGAGQCSADRGYAWPLPPRDRWPEGPWELAIDVNLAVEDASRRVPAFEETAFTDAAVPVAGRFAREVRAGDAITALHLGCGGEDASPPRVVFGFAGGDLRVDTVGHGPVRDLTGVVYHLEPPVVVPADLYVPTRIAVSCEGQDRPAGELVVGPRVVRARFHLVRDERGSARTPRVDAAFLEPVGLRPGRFAPAEDGSVRVEIDGVTCTAPLVDDAFVPVVPRDPREPAWRGAFLGLAPGVATAWAPGYPPVEIPVDAESRLRPRSSAFEELAREWARRGLALRLEQADRRGVVWPADATVAGDEIAPIGEAFAVQAGRRYAIALRGLVVDAALATTGDQSVLQLERPVPIDGRLGLDVAAFLPLRAQVLPGAVVVAAGARRVRLVEAQGRWRAEGDGTGLVFESRWGFHPEAPREPTGRCALDGLVFARDGAGIAFVGWLLDPAFRARAVDPWPGYAFRAGPGGGDLVVGRDTAAPGLPAAVVEDARALLASGDRAVREVRADGATFELAPVFDDPRQPAVHVEITPRTTVGSPAVRVFAR